MIDIMKILSMAGKTGTGMPTGTGGGGGGPMDILGNLFGGKQEMPEAPKSAPMVNILPQPMAQPMDLDRLRRAVASRPTLGMRV